MKKKEKSYTYGELSLAPASWYLSESDLVASHSIRRMKTEEKMHSRVQGWLRAAARRRRFAFILVFILGVSCHVHPIQ
jgi:hypothetical protein